MTVHYKGIFRSSELINEFICEAYKMLVFWGLGFNFYVHDKFDLNYSYEVDNLRYSETCILTYLEIFTSTYLDGELLDTNIVLQLALREDNWHIVDYYVANLGRTYVETHNENHRDITRSLLVYFSRWFDFDISDSYFYDDRPFYFIDFSSKDDSYKNEICEMYSFVKNFEGGIGA